ncbi:hypothetical protein [Paenibacillus sp. FSL H8-0259]|uniref:hypothetical protein n=1 Tax=Paenibacillus sp. FSL H8-0259 TaxID=1920423 RepID=UPI00096CB717|nr:hypothetical protein [Paenibacillus sp. FSL H8-0259]OMF20306.1 hypothetical protein BK132_34920 [Paenibacillus sp. FSL H8-0259]
MKRVWLNNLFVYLGFLVIVILVFIFGLKYQHHLEVEARTTYQPLTSAVFSVLFPISLGLLLGLLRFFELLRQTGEWKINWIKLCIFGLPSLYVSLLPLLFWSGLSISYNDLPLGYLLITSGTTAHTISGLIFGFLLFYVIEKKSKES